VTDVTAEPIGAPAIVAGDVARRQSARGLRVSLLTGGQDRHYSYGLTMGLVGRGVSVDFIGSDEIDGPELHSTPLIRFLNLRGSQKRSAPKLEKVRRVAVYYARLMAYAATAKTDVFHILWNNKIEAFDRTALMLYYRALGHKVVMTAHNVNSGRRDAKDTLVNRVTLKAQYRLCDRIFVHTDKMKAELVSEFGVPDASVTVIPYGINNAVPNTSLTPAEAKRDFGIAPEDKTLLAFGNIGPYKGLEYLAEAFEGLVAKDARYRLLVGGTPKPGASSYWQQIARRLEPHVRSGRVQLHIRHIPDAETERFFKAADLLVLPYRDIFQSGVLFFGYSFGLPVVVSDVGSLRHDVVDGQTGFVCRPRDPRDLAAAIERYFASDLFRNLDVRRHDIKRFVEAQHSWDTVADMTRDVYASVSGMHAHV
jgi:glycosyltransferase involved in cell wall biosynthesis